jgi:hypothetical protein
MHASSEQCLQMVSTHMWQQAAFPAVIVNPQPLFVDRARMCIVSVRGAEHLLTCRAILRRE